MIVSRKSLLAKLRIVASSAPSTEWFRFDGQRIAATNEGLGVTVLHRSDFRGIVPSILLDLLAVSHDSTTVEIKARNGKAEFLLNGGISTSISVPLRPLEDVFPALPKQALQKVSSAFLRAIEHCCLPSNRSDIMVPEHLGITLIPRNGGLWFYATNKHTISYTCLTPSPLNQKQRVIVPFDFCKKMLALAKSSKTWRFDVCGEHAFFAADDLLLVGKLVISDNPLDLVSAVQRHMPKDFANTAIPLPKRILPLLKRFTDFSKGVEVETKINIKDGIATVALHSRYGSITEHLAMPWHPDLKTIDISSISLLLEACRWAERILFTERAVITNAGAHFCLCAASPTSD